MNEAAEYLTLAQWFSPAFPIGAFSYSHGLEWAVEVADVHDAATLSEWVTGVLAHGSGASDALFLAASYAAEDMVVVTQIDAQCRAMTASRERLLETVQQGAAFCKTITAIWGVSHGDLTYPVAVGYAAKAQGLPPILTAAMYLHTFASNLVCAGMRLIPLGQTDGHRLIRDLAPLCQTLAEQTAHGDLNNLSNTAFLTDIAAMKHETQYSRIFRT